MLSKYQERVLRVALARPAGNVQPTELSPMDEFAVLGGLRVKGFISEDCVPVVTGAGRAVIALLDGTLGENPP